MWFVVIKTLLIQNWCQDIKHKGLFATRSILTLCHCGERHIVFIVVLNVVMLSVVVSYAECRCAFKIPIDSILSVFIWLNGDICTYNNFACIATKQANS
jgi:hypothetical protein